MSSSPRKVADKKQTGFRAAVRKMMGRKQTVENLSRANSKGAVSPRAASGGSPSRTSSKKSIAPTPRSEIVVLEEPEGPEAPDDVLVGTPANDTWGKDIGLEPRALKSQKSGGKWKVDMRYVENAAYANRSVQQMKAAKEGGKSVAEYWDCQRVRIPKEKLVGSEIDNRIDPQKKEQYMHDDEFLATFGMDKVKFNTLPPWKRQNLKADAGLS